MLHKIKLLGVGITNETEENVSEYMRGDLRKKGKKFFIVTPNPEMLVHAHKHPEFKAILNKAEIALPDGIGVFIASGLLGHRLQERIPGVDYIEELCRQSRHNPMSMGFLGGGPGVAKRTVECLIQKYPWIKVRWAGEEWENDLSAPKRNKNDLERSSQDVPWISPYISKDDPIDILFVAFGFPKQEEWIHNNLDKLPVRSAMGVGGAFDYISGNVVRAPYLIRAMGLEWLFRLFRQPWRIKRQFALLEFIVLVVQELIKKRKKKQ